MSLGKLSSAYLSSELAQIVLKLTFTWQFFLFVFFLNGGFV